MSWLKGGFNRAVASSPALSSAFSKAGAAVAAVAASPTVQRTVAGVQDRLLGRQELAVAVRVAEAAWRGAACAEPELRRALAA
jgi:hypothetical protein